MCNSGIAVLNFQMKDLLYLSHDLFSASSSLSYADVCACTQICYLLLFYELFPNTSLLLPVKSPYHEGDTWDVFTHLKSCYCPVLLKENIIPESWRHLRSRHISGDPHSGWGCQGWTSIFIPWRICLPVWGHQGLSFQMDANKQRSWKRSVI